MNKEEFGKYLRRVRNERKLTIRQLDTYSGVSHSYISQVERGNRGIPSPEILQRLSKPLGVDYEELMVRAGYIEEIKGQIPSPMHSMIDDDNFIELINDTVNELFNDDLFTKEDFLRVGLSEDASINNFVNSMSLTEKVNFIMEYMTDNPIADKANKSFINYINALSGKNTKIDLADETIADNIDLYYEGMELTKEEKAEFLAIARGIFSARRALKENK